MSEGEMVEWHHQLNGHEFEQALADGQGRLACSIPWGHKESEINECLNRNFDQKTFRQLLFPSSSYFLIHFYDF